MLATISVCTIWNHFLFFFPHPQTPPSAPPPSSPFPVSKLRPYPFTNFAISQSWVINPLKNNHTCTDSHVHTYKHKHKHKHKPLYELTPHSDIQTGCKSEDDVHVKIINEHSPIRWIRSYHHRWILSDKKKKTNKTNIIKNMEREELTEAEFDKIYGEMTTGTSSDEVETESLKLPGRRCWGFGFYTWDLGFIG